MEETDSAGVGGNGLTCCSVLATEVFPLPALVCKALSERCSLQGQIPQVLSKAFPEDGVGSQEFLVAVPQKVFFPCEFFL